MATGFNQSSGPARPFPIWVVFFIDRYDEEPQRKVAGAFTSEDQALALLRELQEMDDTGGFEYSMDPVRLYERNEDWSADRTNPPYRTIPGRKRATMVPELKGHRCRAVKRIWQQRDGLGPVTRGLQIDWETGALVQLGVERPGTLLIVQRPWSPLDVAPVPDAPGPWSIEPISQDDPLSLLLGKVVHAYSVTENEDGSLGAIRVGVKGGALVVRVESDQFHVDVVTNPSGT